MLYDVGLKLTYDYHAPVHGGRHLIRVVPATVPGVQRVIASTLSVHPQPEGQSTFVDFFGNTATAISMAAPHKSLAIRLTARVQVEKRPAQPDSSPHLPELQQQISRFWSVEPDSPHHFLASSPRVGRSPGIEAYASSAASGCSTVLEVAQALCAAIHRDFTYDPKATDVETTPDEAFALRKGVCQDFAHVMIAALRSIGIPAGYVSGFLRTNAPAGRPRLEGADAMHAWVRVWCGQTLGWVEFDPTNAMVAGVDHISIGHGRDYSDISPIIGVLRTHGSHKTKQSVDVVPIQ
jgi:transglutaminase-like putative cysteine protease